MLRVAYAGSPYDSHLRFCIMAGADTDITVIMAQRFGLFCHCLTAASTVCRASIKRRMWLAEASEARNWQFDANYRLLRIKEQNRNSGTDGHYRPGKQLPHIQI